MSFNKKAHLKANIQAIQTAFTLDKEQRIPSAREVDVLKEYSGFGGLKCVLNPASALSDIQYWTKSEVELFPLVAELHNVIRENSANENDYKRYINSIKNSVLTAFYTPKEVVDALSNAFRDSGITPSRILDPSAGMGEFAHAFYQQAAEQKEVRLFEKDLLTGKMLSYLSPDTRVNIEGFETIEGRYNNYFDLVSSNIPFGEMNVFDSSFLRSDDKVKQNATKLIHNYFFIKGIDTLREGGLLAFITSQGVMNAPANEEVRKWLMDNTNLVSAIRLPNNLFTDYAGTEVGSDLIILQKNTLKQSLNEEEKAFISTRGLSNGVTINNYFQDFSRVVHTKGYNDTDPYGRPALVFEHEGGIEGISNDLKKMLDSDFTKNLNLTLYKRNSLAQEKEVKRESKETKQDVEINVSSEPVMSLYDLFGFSEQERTQVKPSRGRKKGKQTQQKPVQLSMFSQDNKSEKTNNVYPISDARRDEQASMLRAEKKAEAMALRPFEGELKEHYKAGSLVEDNEQIGYLKEVYCI